LTISSIERERPKKMTNCCSNSNKLVAHWKKAAAAAAMAAVEVVSMVERQEGRVAAHVNAMAGGVISMTYAGQG
jgi:hypothetical protein